MSAAYEDRARVRAAMQKLTLRGRDVLERHMGLNGLNPQPFHVIARDLGVSRQRVGQILDRATQEFRLNVAE